MSVFQLSTPVIKKVIVREVISDPVKYLKMPDADIKNLLNSKSNPPGILSDANPVESFRKMLRLAPRNAVIGVEATPTPASKAPKIYYPFFSSHLAMPIKPGEAVWIISDALLNDFSKAADEVDGVNPDLAPLSAVGSERPAEGYWISRVVEPVYVEDLNFTHGDRTKSYSLQETPGGPQALPPPYFPNGIYKVEPGALGNTSEQPLRQNFDYERINNDSSASSLTTREPVPTFTKRPGDLVIQGSNNTLICLGEDRPRSSDSPDSSSNYPPGTTTTPGPRKLAQAGTIDMVVGRSLSRNDQGALEYKPEHLKAVKNSRDVMEAERRTWAQDKNGPTVKRIEGDPSFSDDLSRIYLSMKTDGDANFGFTEANQLPNPGSPLEPVSQTPYSIMKSDEVRIIARPAGGMRIIKEGTRVSEADPGDQAVITMQPDGTIMIDGPKIIVGSGNAKGNGQGDQVLIGGSSASEPIVLGNALKGIIGELIDAIVAITVPTGVGPSGPPVNATQFTGIRGRLDTILSQVGKTK